MLKKIQTKIIMIFVILGIIVTTSISLISVYHIKKLENLNLSTEDKLREEIFIEQKNIEKEVIIGAIVLLSLTVLTGLYVSKILINPFSKLLKSSEKIVNGEKELNSSKGGSIKEIDDLIIALETMNKDLKENLNEVTRQKKQIETILLHLTDGIIAFNIEGKIIHINHAAKTLLNIQTEESFEEIFEKFSVDINMEKIIYLENWTSSEKKIQVNDKSINLFFASFKNENDRPAGVIVVIQDITEHVRLDIMRKEFVADVSHELNKMNLIQKPKKIS